MVNQYDNRVTILRPDQLIAPNAEILSSNGRFLRAEDSAFQYQSNGRALVPVSDFTSAQFQSALMAAVPSNRYLLRPDSVANPIFDTTPTHFFDPTAVGSAATGTLSNPFVTLAQVEAYFSTTLSGLAYGKVLGLKRGTSVRGKLELLVTGFGNSGRSADNPFMIVPYGSAQAAPKIIGAIQVGGSAAPQWSFDGACWFYNTGVSREVDAFQDGRHIYKRADRAAALAAGAGFSYWSGTTLYVIPYTDAANLNAVGTLVEVQSQFGSTTNLGHTLLARYKNQARTGNIIVAGIDVDMAVNSCISIQSDTFTNVTFCDTLQVIGCKVKNAGADQTSIGAGSDGIVITGPSDTVRVGNVYAGGNRIENCLNNAIELNGVSSGILEWQTSIGCGGNSIAELFASCSGVKTQYSFGVGAGDYLARTAPNFKGGGFWVAGYVWDQVNGDDTGNTDVTKNVNNDVAFVVALNSMNAALSYDAGTGGKVVNSLWHSIGVTGGASNGSSAASIGISTTMALPSSVEFSNNIVVSSGQNNITLQVGKTSGVTRNCALTGDGNTYWNSDSGIGRNSTISTVNNAGATVAPSPQTYNNIESWTAGFAAGGNAIDANARMGDPKVNTANGHPQFGSPLIGRRLTMPTGYFVDLAGRPLMTPFAGAYQL